jgi:hypothetical protein
VVTLLFAAAAMLPSPGKTEIASAAPTPAVSKQTMALDLGVRAVIYGLPLVLMDLTMRQATNVPGPTSGFAALVNQFANARIFPSAAFKSVVRANVDTLYSSAFLDLSKEPIVLSVPDTGGRYYLLPILDAWTDVIATPGKRTTGTAAQTYAITGPGWNGSLPPGMSQVKSPTNLVWILGRTQTNGPGDYSAVRAIQAGYKVVPLPAFGTSYVPPAGAVDPGIDMHTPPIVQLAALHGTDFFSALARLLKSNPPPPSDAGVLADFAKIGIVPGSDFDASKLGPDVASALEPSVTVALAKLKTASQHFGTSVNGWHIPPAILGNYGSDYADRAIIALIAFGANLPADAIYPTAFVDGNTDALSGANRYVLHFDAGRTPPVNAFWSVTMYDSQSFFVDNPIDRYAVSSWMPLRRNADGSLDIYIQHDSPGSDKESNWLPCASGDFNVTLRMYWPKDSAPSILDGSWTPPPITKAPAH